MKMIVTIKWNGVKREELTSGERDILDADGITRASEQIQEGYREGELNCEIEDENYSGWWSRTFED